MKPVLTIDAITRRIEESAVLIAGLTAQAAVIQAAAELMVGALREGHTILTAGNGGSAAEALHMAEELTGRYRADRRALPGLSLCADVTALTCIGNDYGFDAVFSRQVEGHGRPGDVLVLFSTSGRAANLKAAAEAARARQIHVLGVLGRDGGALKALGDINLIVPGTATERIQEAHQVILHLLLDAVDAAFAPGETAT